VQHRLVAVARRPNARARPVSVAGKAGAPQPSTTEGPISVPVNSARASAMALWRGWAGSR
jgi:hypothetical protein